MDDTALVVAAQNGSKKALHQLLAKHQNSIFALSRRMLGNDADAYDVTQETLLAIVRGLPRFNRDSRFSTWVYRIASNAVIDEIRRAKRRPTPTIDLESDVVDVGSPTTALGSNPFTALEDRLNIDTALQQIPHDFAVAVVLRDQLGFNYAEIANILDIPIGTVRSRIARGRSQLAELLTNVGEVDAAGN